MDIDLDAIVRTFIAESEEHLVRIEESLIGLETHPDEPKFLEVIFRGAHTIKGNAATLGFVRVAEFAHAFEELLQRLRNRTTPVTQERITLLLSAVDALRQMLPEAIAGAEELCAEHQVLLEKLVDTKNEPAEEKPFRKRSEKSQRHAQSDGRHDDSQALVERADTVRVDIHKLDRMLNLAGEIAVAHGRLRQAIAASSYLAADALEAHDQLERLSMSLQEQVMKARMVPIGPIFRQYLRTVRDVAPANGKSARLVIYGEDVEIDLSMVEKLKDPLTHMVRNALDHGLETPQERRRAGKDPCGAITLKAFYEGANVVIELSDDGAGLNREHIAARARSLGMATEPDLLPDQELFRFIFEPGFSTAEKITGLSGRGVGMDVVRRNIETLRGTVGVASCAGTGTTISIRLPLTLAIIEGFSVGIGDETYVLPLHAVVECIELPAEERRHEARDGIINLRGEPLPYVRLRDWFHLSTPRLPRENAVVIEIDRVKAALVVDQLYGAQQTVIKPLGRKFQDLPGIAGSAILGSGRVALILDPVGLMRQVSRSQGNSVATTKQSQREAATGRTGASLQ